MSDLTEQASIGVFDNACKLKDLSKFNIQIKQHFNTVYEKSLVILVGEIQVACGIVNQGNAYIVWDSKLLTWFKEAKTNLIHSVTELVDLILDELNISEIYIILSRLLDVRYSLDLAKSIARVLDGSLILSNGYPDPIIKEFDSYNWLIIRSVL